MSDHHHEDHEDHEDSPPCFTKGTYIRTQLGQVLVENLKVGDLVYTECHGFQAVKWIYNREFPAVGEFAPIKICKGTLGVTNDLHVSPAHRMVMNDPSIEVLFGITSALVAAKDLINGDTIYRDTSMGVVEYFHLLFDQHEILEANGALSESFYPHSEMLANLGDSQYEEITNMFPEVLTNGTPFTVAYPVVGPHEAAVGDHMFDFSSCGTEHR